MVPDEGLQRIFKVGAGSIGFYGFTGAIWLRDETFFAEARVFVRGSSPEIQGLLDTIQVQARDDDRALALLHGRIEEKFGWITWVRWDRTAHREDRG